MWGVHGREDTSLSPMQPGFDFSENPSAIVFVRLIVACVSPPNPKHTDTQRTEYNTTNNTLTITNIISSDVCYLCN